MKIKSSRIILLAATVALAACKNEPVPTYTVGADDNAIVLAAGIADGGADVSDAPSRAPIHRTGIEEDHHGSHLAFKEGTQLALVVRGTWLGKTTLVLPHGLVNNTAASQNTTATIGAKTGTGNLHNKVIFTADERLYWDDYGSADPANMPPVDGNGRDKGLTIYGAAVDGETTAPTLTMFNTQELPWTLTADQSTGWNTKDLLISNNVCVGGPDGTYKFDQRALGKILEFTHAMSKVTVELTAGAGFVDSKFVNKPEVTLLGFNYTGTVNIEAKTSTPTAATTTDIATCINDNAAWATAHTATATALVFPGNQFANDVQIAKIVADGNTYYVTATKINAAIGGGSPTFEQAKNYILNITVSKTGIEVTATILDWVEVSAENETPIINIAEAYGHTGTDLAKPFDLYRSTAATGSYLAGIDEGNHTVVNYVPAAGEPVVPAHYELATQMYWPNHSTHYFFRGIWPLVDSQDGGSQPIGPTTAQVKENSIEVANVAYKEGYYPSDLMIGIPRKVDGSYDETCKVAGHDHSANPNGICATEGKIRMNFQYAMSQVLVELSTTTGDDKVIFDDATKVEIIDCFATGEIKLSDESSDFTGKTVTGYFMHNIANDDYDSYHDAIIPQSLEDNEHNATLKFRITVKSGDTFDKYETVLGIKDIQVTEAGVKKYITAWEPGKKYTYTLRIAKTGVKVEATIKDWITVTAEEDIWF